MYSFRSRAGVLPVGRNPIPARFVHHVLAGVLVLVVGACSDGPTGLDAVDPLDPAEGPRHRGTVEILAPGADARLAGQTTFRARVQDRAAGEYTMRWSVEGGQENAMSDAADGSADEATVDVSGWSWLGEGPYRVDFRAYDEKGRRMGEASTQVRVEQGEPADTTSSGTPSDTTTAPAAGNPLAGSLLWVDPYSNARRTADGWYGTRPDDAALMERVAAGAQADWFGDWNSDIRSAVQTRAATIRGAGALPVFVAYNIPLRDCNGFSGGGAAGADAYRTWIRAFADGLGSGPAVVILEPDALGMLDCLGAGAQTERLALLGDAVDVLAARTDAVVYLDAGHPNWHHATTISKRLEAAGVARADGFSLNVSNFVTDADNVAYGEAVSDLLGGGVRFVVDSSRNGQGVASDGEWCNPDGRGLGRLPTVDTGHDRMDGYLWVKRPGESDGTCNGGPRAGAWWAEYALGLAEGAATTTVVAMGG